MIMISIALMLLLMICMAPMAMAGMWDDSIERLYGADAVFQFNEAVEDIFGPLDPAVFYKRSRLFRLDPLNAVVSNMLMGMTLGDLTNVPDRREKFLIPFNYSVSANFLPITHQKASGRCWIFAFLNMMRIPIAFKLKKKSFEFSQAHFAYWMTVERYNAYFSWLPALLENGVQPEDPLFRMLESLAISDGGTYTMALNVINKYGLMPKSEFKESYTSQQTQHFRIIAKRLLSKYTERIRYAVMSKDRQSIKGQIRNAMGMVQLYLSMAYGIPPPNMTIDGTNYTSLTYFRDVIKPIIDPNKMIALVADGRVNIKHGQGYMSQFAGMFIENVAGFTCNVPVEELEQTIVRTIKNRTAIWTSLNYGVFLSVQQSLLDTGLFDFKLLRGMKYPFHNRTMRTNYRSSLANHAVLLTDVAVDSAGHPKVYRMENSHGSAGLGKGFLWVTAQWFREYGWEVVVPESMLGKYGRMCLQRGPVLLPIWDALGGHIQA